jgi:hypothetical protein
LVSKGLYGMKVKTGNLDYVSENIFDIRDK